MNAFWAAVVGVAAFIGALIGVVINDLLSEEARGRLDRLPKWIIRLAAVRLPTDIRAYWTKEWLDELPVIVHGDEALPLTRLLRATRYAIGLLFAAHAIRREFMGRAPQEWTLPTPRGRMAITSRLEKAQALVEETGQAISLELGRSERAVQRWAGVVAQTQKEIDAVDDALAGTKARMRPIQEEFGGICARELALNKSEVRMRDLERSLVVVSTEIRSRERTLTKIQSELTQLRNQEQHRQLPQLEAWERILRDPKERKRELDDLALRKRKAQRLWSSDRPRQLEAWERILRDPKEHKRKLDDLALRKWTIQSGLKRERQLKASLKRVRNWLHVLARQRQEIEHELPPLQKQRAARQRELSQLQDRKRTLRAQLTPLEGQVRIMEAKRSGLLTLARRQRHSQACERRRVRRLERAQAILPCLGQNVESALQLTGLPGQRPAPEWIRQSTRLIRTAWWREGARRRALQHVDGSGLGSALALEYTLYQALKLASQEAGRRTLVVTLVMAWLGRWCQSLSERVVWRLRS